MVSRRRGDIACSVLTRCLLEPLDDTTLPPSGQWSALVEGFPFASAIASANDTMIRLTTNRLRERYLSKGDDERAAALENTPLDASETARLMSTTAIVLIASTLPDETGVHPYAVAVAAGDSSAFLLADKGWSPITSVKMLALNTSSAVYPLPKQQAHRLHIGALAVGECMTVMTDGLGGPLGTGKGTVGAFLAEVWRRPPDPLSFASHVGFLRKTFVDDR